MHLAMLVLDLVVKATQHLQLQALQAKVLHPLNHSHVKEDALCMMRLESSN